MGLLVKDINDTEVSIEDRLSNQIYCYHRDKDQISMVSHAPALERVWIRVLLSFSVSEANFSCDEVYLRIAFCQIWHGLQRFVLNKETSQAALSK